MSKLVIEISEALDQVLVSYLEQHPESSLAEVIEVGIRTLVEKVPTVPRRPGSAKGKLKVLAEDDDHLNNFGKCEE